MFGLPVGSWAGDRSCGFGSCGYACVILNFLLVILVPSSSCSLNVCWINLNFGGSEDDETALAQTCAKEGCRREIQTAGQDKLSSLCPALLFLTCFCPVMDAFSLSLSLSVHFSNKSTQKHVSYAMRAMQLSRSTKKKLPKKNKSAQNYIPKPTIYNP